MNITYPGSFASLGMTSVKTLYQQLKPMFNKQGYHNILLTGEPGCGKITLLANSIQEIKNKQGVITKQIFDETGEKRIGFELEHLGQASYPLASNTLESDILFAKKRYIQSQRLRTIVQDFTRNIGDLLCLDEIAPMQLYTPGFSEFATKLLDSPNPLLGAIKHDDSDYEFIQQVKQRKDTLVLTLNEDSRECIKFFLAMLIKKIAKSQQYVQESQRFQRKSTNNIIMQSEHDTRILHIKNETIYCDCDFYAKYNTCSHSIAFRQIQYS